MEKKDKKKTLTISSNLKKKIDTSSINTDGKKSFSVEKKKPFKVNKSIIFKVVNNFKVLNFRQQIIFDSNKLRIIPKQ